jgi:hypothetical protein
MRLNIALITAALSASVAANFIIVTVPLPAVNPLNNVRSRSALIPFSIDPPSNPRP